MIVERQKRSPIWKISDEEFIELIRKSYRWKDVLSFFNLENKGSNPKTLKNRIKHLSIDTSHFLNRIDASHFNRRTTKKDFLLKLTSDSKTSRTHVKRMIIKFRLLKYECVECNNTGKWNNKDLALHLDHINGIYDDNRLENLRFLCPNCHSQTPTFAGKSLKNKKNKKIQ